MSLVSGTEAPGPPLMVQIRRIAPSVLSYLPLILWADSPDRMGCFCRDRTTSPELR